MARAKLRLTVPEDLWIGAVSRSFPEARFRILSALADEAFGVALVEVTDADTDAVVDALAAAEDVADVAPLDQEDPRALLQLETTAPTLLYPLKCSGVPLELPFEVVDGETVWDLTASRDRLSTLGDQLDAVDIQFEVESLRESETTDQLLTECQRRVLATAVEAGHFDVPRTCSLTELADRLGVAKSTCSETLHRAESKVVRRHVAESLENVEPAGAGEARPTRK